jgi:hypothetical protein
VRSHSFSHAPALCRILPARLVALAVTVVFTASQVPAQGPMDRGTTGEAQAASVQATTGSQGSPDSVAKAENADFSAPVPNIEEATLVKPSPSSLDSLFSNLDAQDNGQSSSPTPTTKAKAANTKPPHHGLGVALAITGTVALALGVVLVAGTDSISLCSNEHSGGCGEARTGGYVAIGGGAAIAVTGFYLQFHR